MRKTKVSGSPRTRNRTNRKLFVLRTRHPEKKKNIFSIRRYKYPIDGDERPQFYWACPLKRIAIAINRRVNPDPRPGSLNGTRCRPAFYSFGLEALQPAIMPLLTHINVTGVPGAKSYIINARGWYSPKLHLGTRPVRSGNHTIRASRGWKIQGVQLLHR